MPIFDYTEEPTHHSISLDLRREWREHHRNQPQPGLESGIVPTSPLAGFAPSSPLGITTPLKFTFPFKGMMDGAIGSGEDLPPRMKGWSLKDIPKFEGKPGEAPSVHIHEFEDFLASIDTPINTKLLPRMGNPHMADIIRKFKSSLKGKARAWFQMVVETNGKSLNTLAEWIEIKEKFQQHFNPLGGTDDQLLRTWKDLKWDPTRDSLDDFVMRFHQLSTELGYTAAQQLKYFRTCIPNNLYLYIKGCVTLADAVQELRQGVALAGIAPPTNFSPASQDKPTFPFMSAQEKTVTFAEPPAVAVGGASNPLTEQMDRLASAMEQFTKDQKDREQKQTSRGRNNYRGNNFRQRSRSRSNSRDRQNSGPRGRGKPNGGSKTKGNCHHCGKPGHFLVDCYQLKNRLRRAGKIVSDIENQSERNDEELARMMQACLNTRQNAQSKN